MTAARHGALALLAALGGCDPASNEPAHPGEGVYLRHCFACHQSGVAGAPRFGVGDEWRERLAKGSAAMLDNVKKGMAPGMPPRGACPSCDDEALTVAVDYIVANLE